MGKGGGGKGGGGSGGGILVRHLILIYADRQWLSSRIVLIAGISADILRTNR